MMWHLKQIAVAFDQLINTLLGGWADETLSSRCYRFSLLGITLPMKVIDFVLFFDKDHCKESYLSEQQRMQSPPEQRI